MRHVRKKGEVKKLIPCLRQGNRGSVNESVQSYCNPGSLLLLFGRFQLFGELFEKLFRVRIPGVEIDIIVIVVSFQESSKAVNFRFSFF